MRRRSRRYIVPFGQGLMGWAVEHGEPVLANDALTDPRAMQIPGTPDDPEALVVVPLMADGDVIGCMNISRIGGRRSTSATPTSSWSSCLPARPRSPCATPTPTRRSPCAPRPMR